MKKVLFIDRDGTLIVEPKDTYQIDGLDKLEFIPYCFQGLGNIAKHLDYELVMVTNQDGLGTDSFPEETFWPVHNMMLKFLENEGIIFKEILIDKSFEDNPSPNRKPSTGMLTHYLEGGYDIENSYVIGDRLSDMQLAKNLNCKGILFDNVLHPSKDESLPIEEKCKDWNEVFSFLIKQNRRATIHRKTKETNIKIDLSLDGNGKSEIKTGLNFFDHMLEQLARHGQVDLAIQVEGDLHIDEHHTIEDTAIALGETFYIATKDKRGMMRYGFSLPMDDCLAQVSLDFGGRAWLVWEADFKREYVGDMPTEMFYHFFKSFSDSAKCNLNIKAEGTNEHHKIESIFKSFAKAIYMAKKVDTENLSLPSTKGLL